MTEATVSQGLALTFSSSSASRPRLEREATGVDSLDAQTKEQTKEQRRSHKWTKPPRYYRTSILVQVAVVKEEERSSIHLVPSDTFAVAVAVASRPRGTAAEPTRSSELARSPSNPALATRLPSFLRL